MNIERFGRLVQAHGADPRRWPAAERAAAEALRDRNERAGVLADEAADLDAWLDAAPAPRPSDLACRRVLIAAPAPAVRFGWRSAAGWAAAAAAGVVLGVSLGDRAVEAWRAEAAIDQALAWGADEAEYLG